MTCPQREASCLVIMCEIFSVTDVAVHLFVTDNGIEDIREHIVLASNDHYMQWISSTNALALMLCPMDFFLVPFYRLRGCSIYRGKKNFILPSPLTEFVT